MRQEILQDVRRLPEQSFYHEERTQLIILDILFVYSKLNPDVGYRQGMHELLAPLVYVVCQDAVDTSAPGGDERSLDPTMVELLDASFVEHDSYALFTRLMDSCKSFYEVESIASPNASLAGSQSLKPRSTIVEKSKHIHEGCLSRTDPELATHLKNEQILPQTFLM